MNGRDLFGIICMILPFILMVLLIKFMYKEHRKYNPEIKGGKITVEAIIKDIWITILAQGEAKLHLVVNYVIENKEFTNDMFIKTDAYKTAYLNKGKIITIYVDKKDYYNIIIEPKWLYKSESILKDENPLKKGEN